MGGGGSAPPPVEVNQCDVMENQLKEEYGDDFLTNREKFPLTSQALSYLAGTPCKSHFNYDGLVTEFCGDVDNFTEQVGGGQTCADRTDREMRSRWCLMDDEGQKAGTRLKTNGKCSQNELGNKYHSTATSHCVNHPDDNWCRCYNIKNKVCETNPDAAGCNYYSGLEQNRRYFGEEPEIEDPDNPGKMIACSPSKHGSCPYSDGYKILKEKGHCRPRICESGYIPENATSDCEPSYQICEKDLNIRSMSDSNIVVSCNGELGDFVEPDWWNDESTTIHDRCVIDIKDWYYQFFKITPPRRDTWARPSPFFILDFKKPPLNKTPMTCLPGRPRWRDRNMRYLSYTTGGSSLSLCCCCCMLLLMLLTRRR